MEGLTSQHALSDIEFDLLRQLLTIFKDGIDEMTVEQKRAAIRTIVRKVVWDGVNAHVILFGVKDDEIEYPEIAAVASGNTEEEDETEELVDFSDIDYDDDDMEEKLIPSVHQKRIGGRIANELLMMLRVRKKYARDVSLYEPIGTDKEGNEINLLDIIESPAEDVVENYSVRQDIQKALRLVSDNLTPKEYEVIRLRFGLFGEQEYTQREIAKRLKISRSYVSRIEKNALLKLRRLFLSS